MAYKTTLPDGTVVDFRKPPTKGDIDFAFKKVQSLRAQRQQEKALATKEPASVGEKILDVTGGKEIAQGLGQAVANRTIAPQLEGALTNAIDIQSNLLKAIKERKAKGIDTSKLEGELNIITDQIKSQAGNTEKILNQNELTTKGVIGDALQLGATAAGGAVVGKATKALKGAGALKGAATGAVGGGIEGAAQGAAQALQDEGDISDVLMGAVKGGTIGAVTGGVVGGVVGKVTDKVGKAAKIEQKAIDAVTPRTGELTPTQYKELLRQNKITPKTTLSPSKYIMSESEQAVAKKYAPLLQSKDPVKNSINVIDEISKKDKEVGTFLRENNGIFNGGELKNYIFDKLADISDITVPEGRLNKLKQTMVENFIVGLKKNDQYSLWEARKAFDQKIEKAFSGSPTLQKEIKRGFRNAVQDFIAENTPDEVYKTKMKEMTELFRLEDVLGVKASTEKGRNKIATWIKKNPGKAKIAAVAAGLYGYGQFGVGSAGASSE